MTEKRKARRFWQERKKEKNHLEYLDIGGK
jgi:hypothetical protein